MNTIDNYEDVTIDLPLTLHASKKMLVFFLVFNILIACGTLYGSIKTGNIWYILTTVFFALVIAGFVKSLKNPNPIGIEVTEKGLLLLSQGFFGKKTPKIIPWADIEGFGIFNQGFKYVTYQFTKESGRMRPLGGYILGFTFEIPAEEVAMLLEGVRQGSLQHEISGVVFLE